MTDQQSDEALLRSGARILRGTGWLTAEVGDELVLMNVDNGLYIGFSETGKSIWELLEAPLTLDALCGALAQEYEVTPEQVVPDVLRFLHDLIAQRAATLDPATDQARRA